MERSKWMVVAWRSAQYGLLLAGGGLVVTLLAAPSVGLQVLWNGLIPLAPALLVVAPGLWRNLCPMGTASLIGRARPRGRRVMLSRRAMAWLSLAGVAGLGLIAPARHLALDTSGPMTALMLVGAATVAVLMGATFEGRGGWCTALCPIHPVEKLYGLAPTATWPNLRCEHCTGCAKPCPDSGGPAPLLRSPLERWTGDLVVGGLTGFIAGWFQVPDQAGTVGVAEVVRAYGWPLAGAFGSFLLYRGLRRWASPSGAAALAWDRRFAALAVSTYYWFRLPALVGLGPFPETGRLVDLSAVLPSWVPLASRLAILAFFSWFLLAREARPRPWLTRPVARRSEARPLAHAA